MIKAVVLAMILVTYIRIVSISNWNKYEIGLIVYLIIDGTSQSKLSRPISGIVVRHHKPTVVFNSLLVSLHLPTFNILVT